MPGRQSAGTMLAMVILKFLDERPMHPYEMQQLVRERHLDQVVKLKAGSLYHAVEQLQRAGLIEPIETNREGRRPERTVYGLTEAGQDEFRERLRELLSRPAQEYPRFAVALAFMVNLPPFEVASLLEHRLVALEAIVAGLESTLRQCERMGLDRRNVIEVEYTLAMRRAELEWVRGIVEDMRQGTLEWPAACEESN